MAYQIKIDGLGDLPSAVTLAATDRYNFSQHSSLSNLLNSLSEDVPEDDKTPLGPAKDREGPEYVVMHHFCGGRCVIEVILGFESVARCFHY